ncbi:hypothetical protein K3728_04050 [Rhodobacteraceae bacterium M385]|nr:hypothetical protein K3728_04050 [Rhodobacteraceae bacterium M385]
MWRWRGIGSCICLTWGQLLHGDTTSGVTGVPYFKLLRYTWLYLIALISIWNIVALVRALSTALLPIL